jgi:hypothetical protein
LALVTTGANDLPGGQASPAGSPWESPDLYVELAA